MVNALKKSPNSQTTIIGSSNDPWPDCQMNFSLSSSQIGKYLKKLLNSCTKLPDDHVTNDHCLMMKSIILSEKDFLTKCVKQTSDVPEGTSVKFSRNAEI